MLERLLPLWLVLLGLVAYCWAAWFPGVGDPFLASDPALQYLFALTMLAIGSLLPQDEVRQVAKRWPTVLGGTAIQYTVMPILAYGFGRLLGLEGPAMIGIVMVGCVPGAMASNVLTLTARGNVSYSVSLTTSATLLSPLVVPPLLMLALGQEVDLSARKVSVQLCWMVVLPVVAGHLLSRRFVVWRAVTSRVGSTIANLTILWIIAVVVAENRDYLAGLEAVLLVALAMINLGGYLAGWVGGRALRLTTPMRRALTLEVGMQNAGLGAVLASKFFENEPTAAIAPAAYTFGCMLTGTILARVWAEISAGEAENVGEE